MDSLLVHLEIIFLSESGATMTTHGLDLVMNAGNVLLPMRLLLERRVTDFAYIRTQGLMDHASVTLKAVLK